MPQGAQSCLFASPPPRHRHPHPSRRTTRARAGGPGGCGEGSGGLRGHHEKKEKHRFIKHGANGVMTVTNKCHHRAWCSGWPPRCRRPRGYSFVISESRWDGTSSPDIQRALPTPIVTGKATEYATVSAGSLPLTRSIGSALSAIRKRRTGRNSKKLLCR